MRDDAAYLLDILIAARDAQSFVSGLTWEEFQASRLHQSAVIKAIEIIVEPAVECQTRQGQRIRKSRGRK